MNKLNNKMRVFRYFDVVDIIIINLYLYCDKVVIFILVVMCLILKCWVIIILLFLLKFFSKLLNK